MRHPSIALSTQSNNNPFYLIQVLINRGLVETRSRIKVQAIGMEGLPLLLLLEHCIVTGRLKEPHRFHLFDGVGDESSELIYSQASCSIHVCCPISSCAAAYFDCTCLLMPHLIFSTISALSGAVAKG